MKLKCGTDIIEIDRIEEAISSLNDKFLERVYTEDEIKYCESKNKMKYQHYAGRFAAKEAIFKVISDFLDSKYEINWKNIEIVNDKNGRPKVNLVGIEKKELKDIDVTISHCKKYATATAVLLSD